ncbi:YdcF family protein [Romeria aff. gracilis LEGE 07310]|uniref:YdcF family protein n=1 Tax=Vasconcelosia minhoensis LEGE 07310 TaxID=915328 RepID=A0A8J7AYY9_9CYAN|nr:YdcF family protein [Romeria gracilis]MBE9080508.1 YdcF family protein [Romeria aff. gracilis LEGE 07310]
MFLFLSKLLPLLIYPLGLSCLLLTLGLFWLWRSPKRLGRVGGAIAAALIVLYVSSNPWASARLVQSLEWRYLPPETTPRADAIVVLGGSTFPATPPRPWVEVTDAGDRVLHGSRLYRQGYAPLLILSGGRIDWKDGGPPEADDMRQIAAAMGVPRADMLLEGTSLNTYQNAINVKKLLDARDLKSVLLVTSAIHMPRSVAIFKKQGIDVIPMPTDFYVTEGSFPEMRRTSQARLLNLLPNAEAQDYFTRALKEYIGFAIYWLKGWV